MDVSIGTVDINAKDVVGSMTVAIRVSGLARTMARLKIGLWIIKIGSYITGAKVDISVKKSNI